MALSTPALIQQEISQSEVIGILHAKTSLYTLIEDFLNSNKQVTTPADYSELVKTCDEYLKLILNPRLYIDDRVTKLLLKIWGGSEAKSEDQEDSEASQFRQAIGLLLIKAFVEHHLIGHLHTILTYLKDSTSCLEYALSSISRQINQLGSQQISKEMLELYKDLARFLIEKQVNVKDKATRLATILGALDEENREFMAEVKEQVILEVGIEIEKGISEDAKSFLGLMNDLSTNYRRSQNEILLSLWIEAIDISLIRLPQSISNLSLDSLLNFATAYADSLRTNSIDKLTLVFFEIKVALLKRITCISIEEINSKFYILALFSTLRNCFFTHLDDQIDPLVTEKLVEISYSFTEEKLEVGGFGKLIEAHTKYIPIIVPLEVWKQRIEENVSLGKQGMLLNLAIIYSYCVEYLKYPSGFHLSNWLLVILDEMEVVLLKNTRGSDTFKTHLNTSFCTIYKFLPHQASSESNLLIAGRAIEDVPQTDLLAVIAKHRVVPAEQQLSDLTNLLDDTLKVTFDIFQKEGIIIEGKQVEEVLCDILEKYNYAEIIRIMGSCIEGIPSEDLPKLLKIALFAQQNSGGEILIHLGLKEESMRDLSTILILLMLAFPDLEYLHIQKPLFKHTTNEFRKSSILAYILDIFVEKITRLLCDEVPNLEYVENGDLLHVILSSVFAGNGVAMDISIIKEKISDLQLDEETRNYIKAAILGSIDSISEIKSTYTIWVAIITKLL